MDYNILVYILLIIFMFIFVMSIKNGRFIIFKWIFKTLIGAILVYGFNILGQNFNYTIPLNLITSISVGVLGIPGILLIVVMEWAIF